MIGSPDKIPPYQKQKREKAVKDINECLKFLVREYVGRGISDPDMRKHLLVFEDHIRRLKQSIKP